MSFREKISPIMLKVIASYGQGAETVIWLFLSHTNYCQPQTLFFAGMSAASGSNHSDSPLVSENLWICDFPAPWSLDTSEFVIFWF